MRAERRSTTRALAPVSLAVLVLGLLGAGAAGCRPWTPSSLRASRPVLLLPRSLESHAITARQCAFRSLVGSVCYLCARKHHTYNPLTYMRWSADFRGANVVVMVASASRISRYNNVTSRSARLTGKAVFCSASVIKRLSRLPGADGPRR
ncbi:MAG: hypothetical protein KC503_32630 [Myxococcales bacterium]|nr:hypothetical protein [Myxococcales bacterium]